MNSVENVTECDGAALTHMETGTLVFASQRETLVCES